MFVEQHLGYLIDDQVVVRLGVDATFEAARIATLDGLGAVRYRAVFAEFEEAHRPLNSTPPNGKAAIRSRSGLDRSPAT